MTERLLTKAERREALALGPGNVPAVDIYLEAQDKKTSAARLRECGEWLAAYLKDNSGGILWASDHIGVITQLERGEAPWEVKS